MLQLLKRFVREEEGMETVEYAVMGALITLGAVVIIGTLGETVTQKFTDLNTAIQ